MDNPGVTVLRRNVKRRLALTVHLVDDQVAFFALQQVADRVVAPIPANESVNQTSDGLFFTPKRTGEQ